jgi:hypothetical protein
MMKKYLFLIVISLLLNLSKSIEEFIENNSVSKLISMVRTEIIDKSLQDLPRRKEVEFLQMISKMINARKEYSLNEAESAYLVFKWISENIKFNYYDEDLDDPINAYNSGKGTPKSLCSLFNNMSKYLKVVSDSISGYLKWDYRNEIQSDRNYTWNYVEIQGEYYLLDVSIVSDTEFRDNYAEFIYLYFGTEPEIFIRQHFPKENKWQLLSEPYTLEKFESMALLTPFFYLLGFKTISPDTSKIIGDGKIILTSDKLITKVDLVTDCFNDDGISTGIGDDYEDGSPDENLEIEYTNEDECSLYSIDIKHNYTNSYVTVAHYSINYPKNSSSELIE